MKEQNKQLQHALRIIPNRASVFALTEIAFLVCLCSADGVVSLTACNCLRLLTQVERQPDSPPYAEGNEDEAIKRHPVYEQLGDPKVSMIGAYRVGLQRNIVELTPNRASGTPEAHTETHASHHNSNRRPRCGLAGAVLPLVCTDGDDDQDDIRADDGRVRERLGTRRG